MKKTAIFLPLSLFMLIIFGCNGIKSSNENKQKNLESTSDVSVSSRENPIDQNEETEEEKLFYELTKNLQKKYEAGEINEAKASIKKIKTLLPKYKDNWNYGNAVHKINIVAGRIALKEGKIEEAKKYLIAAGRTKGSPQLNSFGPNMTLAKELLEKKETEVVMEYFDLCSVFWKKEFSSLDKWKELVEKGMIPEFGANLKY